MDSGPLLSSSLCCNWVALLVMVRCWTQSPRYRGTLALGGSAGLIPEPAPGCFSTIRSGPLHTPERSHIIPLAFLASSVPCCAHPSRAQSVSSTPSAGGSHPLGQHGTLLTAHSELAAHLPGTTIPAHGSWIAFPQDPELTWIPVRTKGLGGNTFHHHSEDFTLSLNRHTRVS